jgi:catechol 2,3-dioxygenase-like lactoylglutathione lyase family enzyme
MRVTRVTPILNVSNLEATFAWFGKLGWKKDWDFGSPPDFGAVVNGAGEIFLCLNGQGAPGTWMSWWVESPADVDEVHRLAVEHKIVVTQEPVDFPWNTREVHLRHPDGHTFRVGASLPED